MAVAISDTKKEHYAADIEKSRQQPAPDWLKAVRESGGARFRELELPHGKMEAWRFTNIAPITGTAYTAVTAPAAAPGPEAIVPFRYNGIAHVAVFVNGFFEAGLSTLDALPQGIRIESIAAAGTNGAAGLALLDRHASAVGNAYTALNSALLTDGAVVHIAPKTVCEDPIHLLFVTTGLEGPAARFPRILVHAGEAAQASIIESYVHIGGEDGYLNSAVAEYILEPAANVHVYKLIEESNEGCHLALQRVAQGRDSHYTSHVFNLSGKIARNEVSVLLEGEGAACSLHGLYLGEGGQLIDNHQSIDHAKPHCTSWIGYKGVLDGKSKAVYTGKILVRRDSQKTDSNQLNQNLLLSGNAQIDTKPQLEIYADDVKCTHGATIGQFPPELIHYFRTRGIAADMANAMLTYGFADEVVAEVEAEPLRERLDSYVFDKYSP